MNARLLASSLLISYVKVVSPMSWHIRHVGMGTQTSTRDCPDCFKDITIARHDGRYQKFMAQVTKCEVSVLDDLLISPLSQDDQKELLEIVEERYDRKATIVTSQLHLKA
jgi:DNA replication protein DnaC